MVARQGGEEEDESGGKVFCGEGAVERLLYLVLSQLDKAWGAHRFRGFAETGWEATMLVRRNKRYSMFLFGQHAPGPRARFHTINKWDIMANPNSFTHNLFALASSL